MFSLPWSLKQQVFSLAAYNPFPSNLQKNFPFWCHQTPPMTPHPLVYLAITWLSPLLPVGSQQLAVTPCSTNYHPITPLPFYYPDDMVWSITMILFGISNQFFNLSLASFTHIATGQAWLALPLTPLCLCLPVTRCDQRRRQSCAIWWHLHSCSHAWLPSPVPSIQSLAVLPVTLPMHMWTWSLVNPTVASTMPTAHPQAAASSLLLPSTQHTQVSF